MIIDRIKHTFEKTTSEGRTALFVFLTAGFPNLETTEMLIPALVEAGADGIEIGVPFSDPLADGPVIQSSSYDALQQGVSLEDCINLTGSVRDKIPETPIILMGYYNPILSYGLDKLTIKAEKVGIDGFIVADLPTEESGDFRKSCRDRNMHLIPLVAPTSSDERIRHACNTASGFVYCVTVTGVTGTRDGLSGDMFGLLERARKLTNLPLAVGFGISQREHIENIGRTADAVIVGSAMIREIQESPADLLIENAVRFVSELRRAA